MSYSNLSFSAKNYTNVTIKDVILNLDTGVHFRINETMIDDENCGSIRWFKVESGSQYEKEAFAILLAYEAQRQVITIQISGCAGGYPRLHYIY